MPTLSRRHVKQRLRHKQCFGCHKYFPGEETQRRWMIPPRYKHELPADICNKRVTLCTFCFKGLVQTDNHYLSWTDWRAIWQPRKFGSGIFKGASTGGLEQPFKRKLISTSCFFCRQTVGPNDSEQRDWDIHHVIPQVYQREPDYQEVLRLVHVDCHVRFHKELEPCLSTWQEFKDHWSRFPYHPWGKGIFANGIQFHPRGSFGCPIFTVKNVVLI